MIRALLLAGAALLLPAPALADTLVDNIDGISVDREGKITRFAAMVIGNDGRIKRILNRRDDAPRVDFREDGKGRVVIPGIIDSHTHIMALGLGELSLDLSETTSLDEALSRLAAYAAAHPENPWIVGHGWNQERWGLGRFPTAAEIDAVVSDRGVWLTRVDGHAGWANSVALAAAEITAKTADPTGGRIERIAGSKAPAGVLVDAAMQLVETKVPPPRPQDRDQALHEAQEVLLSNGVTAVADMGTTIEDWMTYRRAGDLGRLRLRIMAYADSVPTMLLVGGTGPTPWLYDDRLRLNGIKLLLDGALGSRGALLKAPYADDPANNGLARLNGTQLRNLMSRASMSNFQVAIHAIGDAANDEALFAIEDLSDDFTGDRRWRIEHAQIIDPADMSRFGQHGIIASMQPTHQTSDWKMAEARLGPDRLTGAYAWNSVRQTGASLAFGSDTPVEAPNPFAGIAAAISREDAAGEPFGGWQGEERITTEQALAAYTAGAAYAGFAEGRFGRLEEGERADFVMIDRDPLETDPAELRNIRVLETWVGGQKLYQADGRASTRTPDRSSRSTRASDNALADDEAAGPVQGPAIGSATTGLESGR
ncbi:amidohydrolase family protein [Altererythrobacter xixiisoli]|uniref:Amidohydrolase family protein n=1 Tax=Croceibacterium xixiisoli TaxID=1476466 RepID=A0A6I4TV28_9SPHN|nr:amidohydrolase [Croceibacterium xixiisoli]MXO98163.1 amidohydrolase family protein [Croceibacterium xixiisoli]